MKKTLFYVGMMSLFMQGCQANTNEEQKTAIVQNEIKAKQSNVATESKEVEVVNNATKEKFDLKTGNVFRSDGFYNGMVSEWLKIDYTNDGKLKTVWYWNVQNEKPIQLKISNIKVVGGEDVGGLSATVTFPVGETCELGIMEDKVTLIHDGDRYQEFDIESN